MAKSTRSKVKRSFRAKKRQDGVYAANEAARLHRLSMKLRALATPGEADGEEDEEMKADGEGAQAQSEWVDEEGAAPAGSFPPLSSSSSWLAVLGLLDPCDVTAERMADVLGCSAACVEGSARKGKRDVRGRKAIGRRRSMRGGMDEDRTRSSGGDSGGLGHLFSGLS